jgi:cytidyltransferase-like protein
MKITIISGYFNPLHGGHLDMVESAKTMGDRLLVIVNNDKQQLLKKGKIILDESNRLRLMAALRDVDEAVLSIDTEGTPTSQPQSKTLEMLAKQYPNDELTFANGGDRNSTSAIPETEVCEKYHIQMRFDAGTGKPDSSTRINRETGHETD